MAKQVIVLEKLTGTVRPSYRVALWAQVPTLRQTMYADPGAASAWKGASSADVTNIKTGAVSERVLTVSFEPNRPMAEIQAELVAMWTAYQSEVNNVNPWVRYGTFYDPTAGGWNAGGVG